MNTGASNGSAPGVTVTDQLVLFWSGWPSQWTPATFVVDGETYSSAEQFMMCGKARLFGDEPSRQAILATSNPREQKRLGRAVRPFDQTRWQAACQDIVYAGNLAKFQQNAGLRALLLATGARTLAEASPLDAIWGIGVSASDPRALDPARWRGQNLLGQVLMRVRAALAGSAGAAS